MNKDICHASLRTLVQVPETIHKVNGENRVHKVVQGPPHACHVIYIYMEAITQYWVIYNNNKLLILNINYHHHHYYRPPLYWFPIQSGQPYIQDNKNKLNSCICTYIYIYVYGTVIFRKKRGYTFDSGGHWRSWKKLGGIKGMGKVM